MYDVRSIARSEGEALVIFLAHGEQAEVVVTARNTTERWNPEQAPNGSKAALNEILGNAAQLMIAAERTMGMEGVAQGHQARVKARVAIATAPGIDTDQADQIVREGVAA